MSKTIVVDPAHLTLARHLNNNPGSMTTFLTAQTARENHRDPFGPKQAPQQVRVRAGAAEVRMCVNGVNGFWRLTGEELVEEKGTEVTRATFVPLVPSPRGNESVIARLQSDGTWRPDHDLITKPFGTAS